MTLRLFGEMYQLNLLTEDEYEAKKQIISSQLQEDSQLNNANDRMNSDDDRVSCQLPQSNVEINLRKDSLPSVSSTNSMETLVTGSLRKLANTKEYEFLNDYLTIETLYKENESEQEKQVVLFQYNIHINIVFQIVTFITMLMERDKLVPVIEYIIRVSNLKSDRMLTFYKDEISSNKMGILRQESLGATLLKYYWFNYEV
jgi:hypothetical protein